MMSWEGNYKLWQNSKAPYRRDAVSIIQYDAFGRETYKYLPYIATTNDVNYKNTAIADQYQFQFSSVSGRTILLWTDLC